ncbi:MAG: phosphotransferase, partial [Dehalococcoidia bacterium]|nr:phosphotransferase [Dehalococcoidia bacterium]
MTQEPPRKKIAEGREAEIFAREDGTVLRLMRSADARESVEWQARALEAARAAGVSVPAVHGTTTVDGRPGLIMERVDGPDMLTLLGKRPWWILHVGRVSGELHAGMH